MLLVVNYHMMCFTNFVTDAETRSKIGISLIFCVVFVMVCNWGQALIEIVCRIKVIKFWCRK